MAPVESDSDGKRELHLSDVPLGFPTMRAKLGKPLPDTKYDTCADLLRA